MRYIYVLGEQQTAIIELSDQIMQFTKEQMGQIESEELHQVIGNVFANGEFFPGPEEVLTSVVHEIVRRCSLFQDALQSDVEENFCVFLTAFRLFDGSVITEPLAIGGLDTINSTAEMSDELYTLLLKELPRVQNELTKHAYAPDSKVVQLIKDAATYHQKIH